MAKDPAFLLKLNRRFTDYISKRWVMNEHPPKEVSAVYVIIAFDFYNGVNQIQYVGSTTDMCLRYKSHKIPKKIQDSGYMNILYYLPMKAGFYDYELKLIRKLQPKYNRNHKNVS